MDSTGLDVELLQQNDQDQLKNQKNNNFPGSTTISTIVLQSEPLRIVVALLQSDDIYHIKVVEIAPQLTFLGTNIDEAVQLQKEHDVVLKRIQEKNTPIDEFIPKAEKLLLEQKANPDLLDAMGQSLTQVWNDMQKLLKKRKQILDLNANFHEKIGACRGKMSALEVACRDTMIPIEIESVQEFLNKFKQLRIEMLAAVMAALKDGNELLAKLRELLQTGTLDTRPDHIKLDVKKSVGQVECWLEDLHDKRNGLEIAWQTRKIQLEQCLALAIFAKDLLELENILQNRRNALTGSFHLGESVSTVGQHQNDYMALKQDAISLRDRALKITRATEKLVSSGCFAGDEASAKAYGILSGCTEYLNLVDYREHLLQQSHEFFVKSTKCLQILEQLEIEVSTTKLPKGSEEAIAIHCKVLKDIVTLSEEPLRLGYQLLDEVGRDVPESTGVKRTVEEIENRKIYLEEICSTYSEKHLKVSESLNVFLEKYNSILSWLVSIAEAFLRTNNTMGISLDESKEFLHLHHQLLSDLEVKGNDINNLLLTVTQILESLDDQQRKDVDQKVDSLHKHWTELKNIIESRVDLVTMFIQFMELANSLSNMFEYIEKVLKNTPEEEKLKQLDHLWSKVKPAYAQLKNEGTRFIDETSKVADPYLKTKNTCSCVEEILSKFSNRQINITESWEDWTTFIVEKRETEILWEKIMTENVQTINAASKLDAQLYPILTNPTENLNELKQFLTQKLQNVLTEIEKAHSEIQQRINSTAALKPKDSETSDKVLQVINNLSAIKEKLKIISVNYKILVEEIIEFLKNIIELKTEIDDYFVQQRNTKNNVDGNVDVDADRDDGITTKKTVTDIVRKHEQFRDKIMERFRSLIKQSERIIERIRDQEPIDAKEYDTDRILSLLEKLRIVFESENETKVNELKKQHELLRFNRDLNEINRNLDDLRRQLRQIELDGIGETLATVQASSMAFTYFEQTIELLGKRIDNFINTSDNLCKSYPDTLQYVNDEVDKLKIRWDELKENTLKMRKMIDGAVQYYTLLHKIETKYQQHTTYLLNITNRLPTISTEQQANDLINQISTYISENEPPQMIDLKSITDQSIKLYGYDKTITLHSDNIAVFQSLFKLKSDITLIAGDLLKKEQEMKLLAEQSEQRKKQFAIINNEIDKKQTAIQEFITKSEKIQEQLITTSDQTTIINGDNDRKKDIMEAPKFIVPLSDASIKEGDKFTFECTVTGYPEPFVEWFKDGMSIQNNPDYLTTYNNMGLCTLSIEETFTEDSARFMCRASNAIGMAETIAILSVKETIVDDMLMPPNFIKLLESGQAHEGKSFEFHCTVTGNPLPIVQWFKNDVCIDMSPDYLISYNNGEATLRFEEVFLEDQDVFTCKATNQMGFDQCSANLIVEPLEPTEMPIFKVPLSNVMARVGQKIKLECQVTGIPRPEIYWTHKGKPFSGRDAKLQYENETVTCVIPEAFPKDAGIYKVIAKNLAGEAFSTGYVSVKGRLPNETSDSELASDMEPIKPTVQLPLKDICVVEGKSVRLDCIIVGQPEPEVIWYHNNRPVKESTDVQLLFQGDRCSLVIQEAFIDDIGEYKVVAINSAGEASSKCTLTVQTTTGATTATTLNESTLTTTTSSTTTIKTILNEQNESEIIDNKISSDPSLMAPKFEKLLTDILVADGDNVELECSLVGNPKPIVKWFLNSKEIYENENYQFIHIPSTTTDADSSTSQQSLSTTEKLLIKSVSSVRDKGLYTIKAMNSLGEAKCFSHLIVKSVNVPENDQRHPHHQQQHVQQIIEHQIDEKLCGPTFKELFSDKWVHEDDTVKFECIVIGKPTPKIKWFFNDSPVHGQNFLASTTNGDRQVLCIPKMNRETIGKISCVAENEMGKAICIGYLNILESKLPIQLNGFSGDNVQFLTTEPTTKDQTQQHQQQQQRYIEEHNTGSSSVSIKKQIFTSTHTSQVNTIENTGHQQTQIYGYPGKLDETGSKQIESKQYQEYKQTNELPPTLQQKSVITLTNNTTNANEFAQFPKTIRKQSPPRFVCPFVGKIVDQGADIHLEAIIDGFPSPDITITKNGERLAETDSIIIMNKLNKIMIDIKNVNVNDAGRYSCTATNTAGTSTSTADIVVKKSIFPPVFGHRLQAQVVKRGERVLMDVEVSGAPEPTVTWYKDNYPINDKTSEHKIKKSGNNYTLIIEKVKIQDAGKYMVKATNAGGEAQSIADFAVIEPTPERMVEVIKTIVFDSPKDQQQKEVGKTLPNHNIPKTYPSTEFQSLPPTSTSSSFTTTVSTTDNQNNGTTEETITTETKRTTETIMRMEHKTDACFDDLTLTKPLKSSQQPPVSTVVTTVSQKTQTTTIPLVSSGTMSDKIELSNFGTNTETQQMKTDSTQTTAPPPPSDDQQSTIETSSISKQTAYEYFINKMRSATEAEDSQAPITKTIFDEQYRKIEDFKESPKKPDLKIPISPIQSKIADFTKSLNEIKSINYQTDEEYKQLNITPGSPPEIGFMPKLEDSSTPTTTIKRENIADRIKKLEQSHKELTDIPSGGIRTLPFKFAADDATMTTSTTTVKETKEISYNQSSEPIYRPSASLNLDTKIDSARSPSPRPSADAIAMEKLWTPIKLPQTPPTSEEQQSTLTTKPPLDGIDFTKFHTIRNEFLEEKIFRKQSSFSESDIDISKQESTDESENFLRKQTIKDTAKIFEEKIKEIELSTQHDYDLRAPGLLKQIVPKPKPDITASSVKPLDDIYLEPGSPPEVCYAPRPQTYERKKSLVETIEETLEKDIEKEPKQILPGSVRIIPPPLPLKHSIDEPQIQPPVMQPLPPQPPPPTIPSKYVKSEFSESDYESERYKSYESDTDIDRNKYRSVQPPKNVLVSRPRSTDPIPPSPCQFEEPLKLNGELRTTYSETQKLIKPKIKQVSSGYMADTEDTVYHKSTTMTEQRFENHSINQSRQFFESHSQQQPQQHQQYQSQIHQPINTNPPAKHYRHHIHKQDNKDESSRNYAKDYSTTTMAKNISINSKYTKIREEPNQSPYIPYTPTQASVPPPPPPLPPVEQQIRIRHPPPPSPSKFIKGEFKGSDYESDYDTKIAPMWRPTYDSDSEPLNYKPIRPNLTPTMGGRISSGTKTPPTPPSEFDRPPQFDGPPRPKFEPIDKFKLTKTQPQQQQQHQQQHTKVITQTVYKPTPVSPNKIYQPQPQKQPTRYYTGIAGTPLHNASIASETSNTMHMRESTENSHRIVNMTQTKRIIQFDARKNDFEQRKLEPFPYTVQESSTTHSPRPRTQLPPTPTKFIPCQFGESDYESEVESTRIRPLWTPNPSDTDEPQYRKVNAPCTRSQSLPRTYGGSPYSGRVMTPMEFDKKPPEMPSKIHIDVGTNHLRRFPPAPPPATSPSTQFYKTQTLDRHSMKKTTSSSSYSNQQEYRRSRDDIDLKQASPPTYGYIVQSPVTIQKPTPTRMVDEAQTQMHNMSSAFKSKAQKFMTDIVDDATSARRIPQQTRPILKKTISESDSTPQAYREENRISQYGTKHIDPDTGLIYFKYDFGYEFGIIFPGEGKKFVGNAKAKSDFDTMKSIKSSYSTMAGDINIPVMHEKTTKSGRISATSDSEYSEMELDPKRKRYSLPVQINVDEFHRNDKINNKNSENTWNLANTSTNATQLNGGTINIPVHSAGGENDNMPKRPPLFITPLKDIAAVSGQTARFECIVQCDPHPNIMWSRNSVILQNSNRFIIEFRNGVCRLTIPEAFPADAGIYTCIANNILGSVTTSAELIVPAEQWSVRT